MEDNPGFVTEEEERKLAEMEKEVRQSSMSSYSDNYAIQLNRLLVCEWNCN